MQELTLIYGDRGAGKTTFMVRNILEKVREYQVTAGMSYEDACKTVPILHNIEGLEIGLTFQEFMRLHPHLGFRNVRSFFQPIYEQADSVYKVLLGYTFYVDEATILFPERDLNADTSHYMDRMRHYGHTAYFASVALDYPKGFCEKCQNYIQAVTDAHNPFPFFHMYIRRTGSSVRSKDSYSGFFLLRKSKRIYKLFKSAISKSAFRRVSYRPAMYLSLFALFVVCYCGYYIYNFVGSKFLTDPAAGQQVAADSVQSAARGGGVGAGNPLARSRQSAAPVYEAPSVPQTPPEPVPCLPGYPLSRLRRDQGNVPLHVSSYVVKGKVYVLYDNRWINLSKLAYPYYVTRDGVFLLLPPTEYCFSLPKNKA